ncbi:uncharacterized protein LOC127866650 [Dreissena polymorpha]|uniref:Uncharacterized protein n=1 Tax=Dreissena polymorpha TaxID=45954 RepID=A0A9D4LT98_DREPO|nr:uncharacterized protein LOC127866650 [Dreissena polymorpha]KAH3863800.1 hypothetical protein DPMN_026800 [Dreissena polymorpha]
MILLITTLTLVVCLEPVLCQTKYCCTPLQWESVNLITDARDSDSPSAIPTLTQGFEQVSVDGVNHRVASMATLTSSGFNISVQVIQLFEQNVMYTIESGECKKTAIPSWTPKCVPDSAEFQTQVSYGQGSNKVDVWIYRVVQDPNTIYLNVAVNDCTPIFEAAYGSAGGVSALSSKTFTNFTLGIKDPIVFHVPEICNQAKLVHTVPKRITVF